MVEYTLGIHTYIHTATTYSMPRTILSINAGSSSVKMTVYTFESPPVRLATAQVAGLTAPPQVFKYSRGDEEYKREVKDESVDNPHAAFEYLVQYFIHDPKLGDIASKDDFAYLCHRVVHGGNYEREAVITHDTYDYLEALQSLAPLYVANE